MGGSLPQPLPWAMVEDYADRAGLGRCERLTLHQVLEALDADWLADWRDKAKRADKGA